MVALQIRGVSDEVRDALSQQARRRGQSLQAFLLRLVEAEAGRARNAEVLTRMQGRSDGTRLEPGEAASEIAAAREERAQNLDVAG